MTRSGFVHLHNHSEYSLLDGANRIRDLVAAARAHAMPALAITDHGAMHGCIEFYKEAHHQGVKPILGCETYLTTGSRHDRTPSGAGGPVTHHLVLLAKNETGYPPAGPPNYTQTRCDGGTFHPTTPQETAKSFAVNTHKA